MLLLWAWGIAFPLVAAAQNFSPLGTEYSVSGALPGDQSAPSVSLSTSGGYIVWQDNVIDGAGSGIAARKLDGNFSGSYGAFRVNLQSAGEQEKPQVSLLSGGYTAFVWQGGKPGYQNIYLRFLNSAGTFTSQGDVRVNSYTNGTQTHPTLAALADGNALVVWSSLYQDGSQQGIYARLMSPAGQNLGNPFLVNQYTANNQRSPAVATVTNGNFVIAWISDDQGLTAAELSQGAVTAPVYARLYNRSGQPLGNEFRVSTGSNICANPTIGSTGDGGFLIAWSQRSGNRANSWDVYGQAFDSAGLPVSGVFRINSTTYGDQFAPKVANLGTNNLIIWTSLGQDGSWEGVFGQLFTDGQPVGGEFQVNTTTWNKQFQPTIASDGTARFLVAWAGMAANGFDLFGQRYAIGAPSPQPFAPWVSASGESTLTVTWPELAGYSGVTYQIFMDGALTPTATANGNFWKATGLQPSSSHTFRIAYHFGSGQVSALSPPATGLTWGEDLNHDGVPDDWQSRFWPELAIGAWPPGYEDSDGDGVSNYGEFLAGTDPRDASSVLKIKISFGQRERRLTWTARQGTIYQVQVSNNFETWSNFGAPRLAAGTSDSVVLSTAPASAYYRVVVVQ
ncbi:MAG: hypothetical protein JWM16_10 [Verrucomicrobiales bacterium]|nr:hypothetical protein [Verrucomicrobiales bacterium]